MECTQKPLAFVRLSGGCQWLGIAFGNTMHRQSSLYKHGESWLRKIDRVVEKFHANGFVHGDLRLSNITVPCTTVYGSPRSHARNGTKFRLGRPSSRARQCSSFFLSLRVFSCILLTVLRLLPRVRQQAPFKLRLKAKQHTRPNPNHNASRPHCLSLSPFLFSTPLVSSHALGQHLTTQAATTR
ncbi:hypothetical protein BGY98DRAFT_106283 [Russula aff. rugulosa BPL654]|nr:hypothetical protein BGY98DRAFT_106283 [Russula aff. rugulosa BPL654]